MNPFRYLLLHHQPGICAPQPPEKEKPDATQTARIRQALLSQPDELGMTRHERAIRELYDAPVTAARSVQWAAREALEATRQAGFKIYDEAVKKLGQS